MIDYLLSYWFCRCQFSTFEQCQEWLKRLNTVVRPPSRLEDLFSFAFHAWCMEVYAGEKEQHGELCRPGLLPSSMFPPIIPQVVVLQPQSYRTSPLFFPLLLFCFFCRRACDFVVQERGGEDGLWHSECLEDIGHQQQVQVKKKALIQDPAAVLMSFAFSFDTGQLCYTLLVLHPMVDKRPNPDYVSLDKEFIWAFRTPCHCLTLFCVAPHRARLCPSYPQQLLVPAWITDKELENVAAFRSWKRFPAVVYRSVCLFLSLTICLIHLLVLRNKTYLCLTKSLCLVSDFSPDCNQMSQRNEKLL